MTLRGIISRIDTFDNPEVINIIYATRQENRWIVDAPAFVVETPLYADENYVEPPGPEGTRYFLEVYLAKKAIKYAAWSVGAIPSLDDKVAAVIYYVEHDVYLPIAGRNS